MVKSEAKLMTVACEHCGKKNHATPKQFLEGVDCSACGMPVTIVKDNQDSSANNATCLGCGHNFTIPVNHNLKYLAECPSCKTLFLRKNLVFDRKGASDEETEAFKLLESLYPTIPNNLAGDLGDAQPASEAELKLLQDLKIKAQNPTSRAIKRLTKTIFERISVLLQTHFSPILYFPEKLQNEIMMKVGQSSIFADLYFDRTVYRDRLEEVVSKAVGDSELYDFINMQVNFEAFEIAIVYLLNYAKIVCGKTIDAETARMLAIRSFARGFGQNIHKAGYFIYSHDEKRVKNITRLSPPAMKSYYTKRSSTNESIGDLLGEHGFAPQSSGGCLGMILFFIIAAFVVGRFVL